MAQTNISSPKSETPVTEPAVAVRLFQDVLNQVENLIPQLRLVKDLHKDVDDVLAHLEETSNWLKEKLGLVESKVSKAKSTKINVK